MNDGDMAWPQRLKRALLKARSRFRERRAWRKRHRHVFALHPEYARPCPRPLEGRHLKLWRQLDRRSSPDTLRVCFHISGRADAETVPEEVFAADIEPALNRHDACLFLEDKTAHNHWFDDGLFPAVRLYRIGGVLYGQDYRPLRADEVSRYVEKLDFPLVLKPARGTAGGRGVRFVATAGELRDAMAGQPDFVVQEKIEPSGFFRRFNDYGLNTVRVCTYRSVATDEIHVLNCALRIGREGRLDNLKQGGLVRYIHPDGTLNRYALDIYGGKYARHPDSGIDLTAPETVPAFGELKRVAKDLAGQVHLARLVSLDMCLDSRGRWRGVEINLEHQTIRFAQYAGAPFFGPFTGEVISYCRSNPRWKW